MKAIVTIIFCIASLITIAQTKKLSELTYVVSEGNNAQKNPPIVILLHGYGSNENDLLGYVNLLPPHYRVLSVRAPIELAAGTYAWYNFTQNNNERVYNSAEVLEARKKITRFIRAVKFMYKSEKIYLLGFSQGAIMSYDVALATPGLVKGVIALSGRLLPETSNMADTTATHSDLSVFIGHGTKDDVITLFNAKEAFVILRELKVNVVSKGYPIGHQTSEAENKDLLEWLLGVVGK